MLKAKKEQERAEKRVALAKIKAEKNLFPIKI